MAGKGLGKETCAALFYFSGILITRSVHCGTNDSPPSPPHAPRTEETREETKKRGRYHRDFDFVACRQIPTPSRVINFVPKKKAASRRRNALTGGGDGRANIFMWRFFSFSFFLFSPRVGILLRPGAGKNTEGKQDAGKEKVG